MRRFTFYVAALCVIIFALSFVTDSSILARPIPPGAQSVCTFSDSQLNGPGAQENDAYCANRVNEAFSTYHAAIEYAEHDYVVIGTPGRIFLTHDWRGVSITLVEFSNGFDAQHDNGTTNHDVRIYDNFNRLVYTEVNP